MSGAIRRVIVLAVLLMALLAPTAKAGIWNGSWWLPGGYNGSCVWYYYASVCGWWSGSWSLHQTTVSDTGLAQLLTGYENYNTIRGQWIYNGQYRGGAPSFYSMSGSLKPQTTWWDYYSAGVDEYDSE
jgi:hypothetical protein